jgi:hypothetical protein
MSDSERSDHSRRSPSAESSSSYQSSSSRSSASRRPEEEDRRVRDDDEIRSTPSSRASTPRRQSGTIRSGSGSPRQGSSAAWLDKSSSGPKQGNAEDGGADPSTAPVATTDFAAFYPPPPATYQPSPQLTEEQEKVAILKAQQQVGLEQANKRFHDYAALHSDHIVRPPSPKSSVYLRPLSVRNRRFRQSELLHYHEEVKETARRQKEEKERARLQQELKLLAQKEEAHKAAQSNRNWTPSPRLYPGKRKSASPKGQAEQTSTTTAAAGPHSARPATAGSGKPRFEALYELSKRQPKHTARPPGTEQDKQKLSTKQFVDRFYALPRKEHQAEQDKMMRKYLQSPRPSSARAGKGGASAGSPEDRPDESATIERLAVQDIRRRNANRDALTRRYLPQPPTQEKKISNKIIAERLYVNGVARSNAAMEKVFARAEADFKKHQIHSSVSPLSTERVRALGERLCTPKLTQ